MNEQVKQNEREETAKPEEAEKKTYSQPRLVKHGTVEALTKQVSTHQSGPFDQTS